MRRIQKSFKWNKSNGLITNAKLVQLEKQIQRMMRKTCRGQDQTIDNEHFRRTCPICTVPQSATNFRRLIRNCGRHMETTLINYLKSVMSIFIYCAFCRTEGIQES